LETAGISATTIGFHDAGISTLAFVAAEIKGSGVFDVDVID
jgi:hypothetical protein